MKALKIIAVAALAATLCTSCSMLFGNSASTSTSTQTEATSSNGLAAGTALLSIFNQYKTDGKIDLSNINNILNLATLISNVGTLKNTINTSAFTDGLISGSKNLVSSANAADVVSQLASLSGINLSQVTNAASSFTANASSAVSTASTQINEKSAGVSKALNTLNSIFNTVK